jgi:MOSC domain-containing protein YiiM
MGKVYKIAISQIFKSSMQDVNNIEAIAGKGLIGDRHFKNDNGKKNQITLIEVENINYYNELSNTFINPIDFRRNIITQGIKLNKMVNTEFSIGKVKVRAHDLCRPCKYLQETLERKDIIKEFLYRGGLRCEILNNGKIFVGDEIK